MVEPFASGVIDFIATIINMDAVHKHTVVHGTRLWVDSENGVRSKFCDQTKFIRWKYANRRINPFFDLFALITITKVLLKGRYDVIHLHSAKAGILGRIASLFVTTKKVIYTPHGAPFIRKDISKIEKQVFIALERIGSYLPGQIICCSKSEMEVYHRFNIKAKYINNGVSVEQARSDLKPTNEVVRIGFSGILTEQKNPCEFNELASSFSGDNRVEFIWIGDGNLKKYITSSNIIVTGWVSKSEVKKYLETIDIYLSCSLWEGLPIAVLEAMSLGNPLVLRNSIGNKDLVKPGLNGYLYDTKHEALNSLLALIEDKHHRQKMGKESARICLTSFSEKDTFEKYMIEYASSSQR